MTRGSDNPFPSILIDEEVDPAAPAAGHKRLFIDSADHKLKTIDSSSAVVDYTPGAGGGGVTNGARLLYTGGDITTTSATFVDVDATNAKLTLTTGARSILIGVTATVKGSQAADISFDLDLDGTLQGQTYGLADVYAAAAGNAENLSFTFMSAALTAAAHTIKLKWKTSAGTATVYASSTLPLHVWAIEMGF